MSIAQFAVFVRHGEPDLPVATDGDPGLAELLASLKAEAGQSSGALTTQGREQAASIGQQVFDQVIKSADPSQLRSVALVTSPVARAKSTMEEIADTIQDITGAKRTDNLKASVQIEPALDGDQRMITVDELQSIVNHAGSDVVILGMHDSNMIAVLTDIFGSAVRDELKMNEIGHGDTFVLKLANGQIEGATLLNRLAPKIS